MAFETHTEGALVANGSEQTVTEANEPMRFSGYISLGQMQAGDSIVLRQYVELAGTYEKYAEETYSDAQSVPMIYFTPKEVASSLKVTLEQTVGTFREFPFKFIKELEAIPAATFSV